MGLNENKIQQITPDELIGPLNEVEKKHAPPHLFVAGDIGLCKNDPRVSVIGTREVSDDGIRRTQKLVRILVKHGVVVVSGLARGVDACAHWTAITAKGRTIAVLGTPLDRFYPKENATLQQIIMTDHLAISQFTPGTNVYKGNFPIRNRTMALISHATVIVEAGEGSGTLHQGWEALRFGRPLFLMSSLLKNHNLKWPQKMVEYGAQVLSDETMDMFFELVPREFPSAQLAEMSF